jgi:tellurite resistance protein
VANQPASDDTDWVLKAMVAVAASDGGLDARETGLIQQVYKDQSGRTLSAEEVARAVEALAKGDAIAEFAAASKALNRNAKEGVIRAAYLVLLADNRIAGEERKKLKDIAAALQIPEIHFGTILEDLAVWLAQQRS